jgi:hypothetical protein
LYFGTIGTGRCSAAADDDAATPAGYQDTATVAAGAGSCRSDELESNPLQEEVTAIARKVEDGVAAAKPKPKYERNNEPQPGVVPCINADCDNLVSMSTGTGVKVTYPEGGPKPYDGWLCPECANLLL